MPWTVACRVMTMALPRQQYWSGLPFPSPGDSPNPGIKPASPAWHADSIAEPPGETLAEPYTIFIFSDYSVYSGEKIFNKMKLFDGVYYKQPQSSYHFFFLKITKTNIFGKIQKVKMETRSSHSRCSVKACWQKEGVRLGAEKPCLGHFPGFFALCFFGSVLCFADDRMRKFGYDESLRVAGKPLTVSSSLVNVKNKHLLGKI